MGRPLHRLLLGSLAIRLVLIAWGEFQDKYFEVNYTDIDYIVFTDAARFISRGLSPFERATYRYSPLLAYALLPNIYLHQSFGKVLFALLDVIAAVALSSLVQQYGVSPRHSTWAAAAWLLNPFTATISTRGSCDVIVIVMMLSVLWLLNKRQLLAAGALFGLAVHFRLYPIIYTPSILLAVLGPWTTASLHKCRRAAFFGAVSFASFAALGWAFYSMYGAQFVREAYTFHLTRQDPRHNFSPYFYATYLRHFRAPRPPAADDAAVAPGAGQPRHPVGQVDPGALAVIPQAAAMLLLSLRFHQHLPLCWTLLTISFVAFNKVSTAQYFVWYFGLLPLVLVRLPWPVPVGLRWAGAGWAAAQLHWLLWAYLLEFQGLPVFFGVWLAGLLFLAANTALMLQIMKHTPLKALHKGQGKQKAM